MVRGAVRLDRRVVGVTFHDLVNARFVGAEQAVIAVAGFVRVHGGGQLGEDVLELCFLAGLHAQRRDDADGAHIYLSLLSFRCESRGRSEEHTSELQSLMRISYAVFCLKKKKKNL